MAKIVKESEQDVYSQPIIKRLLEYMKPHIRKMLIALVLVLTVTGFELIKPRLIGTAIDQYIQGYNQPYGVVETSDICFDGKYLSRDLQGCSEFYQLVNYEGSYYLFESLDKISSDILFETTSGQYEPLAVMENAINIDGYIGRKLEKSEIKELRSSDISGLIKIGVLYITVLALGGLCSFAQMWILQLTGQSIIYTIREELFHHIHSLPLRYFDTHPVGSIVTRVTNDVESLHEMYASMFVRLFSNLVKVIGLMIVMLSIDVKMSLMAFALIPFIVILTIVFKNISRKVHRAIRTRISILNTFLSENISGMRIIQIFANEELKLNEFKTKNNELYIANRRQITVGAVFRPIIWMISEIALAFVLYNGSHNVFSGALTIGTLYVFISYIQSFYEPVQDLAEQFTTLQNAFASAEKIFTVLDETNPIVESDNPKSLKELKGKIEFKNVWFAYEDDNYVLKDVSFVIEPGQKVAFVGATGAGKSSILNLVGRYYDIQKGQILIDDIDIKELSTKEIREAIGQVQQDVFIFTGDIESNITLGNDISHETVVQSANMVNANHFIEQLPNTYHEPVSERGSTLSAGQRQLLSFARTLAFDPKILVMDEATANIDTETEGLIQDALEKLMTNRTTIMVAHRLSTIQHADNIIVMHHGRIREQGTHQELLNQEGIYKKLYELQLYSKE